MNTETRRCPRCGILFEVEKDDPIVLCYDCDEDLYDEALECTINEEEHSDYDL